MYMYNYVISSFNTNLITDQWMIIVMEKFVGQNSQAYFDATHNKSTIQ